MKERRSLLAIVIEAAIVIFIALRVLISVTEYIAEMRGTLLILALIAICCIIGWRVYQHRRWH